jgi:hypothetical protein
MASRIVSQVRRSFDKKWKGCMLAALMAAAPIANGGTKVLTRDQVAQKDTWATEDIFPNVAAWETEFKRLEQEIAKLDALKGQPLDGPRGHAGPVHPA